MELEPARDVFLKVAAERGAEPQAAPVGQRPASPEGGHISTTSRLLDARRNRMTGELLCHMLLLEDRKPARLAVNALLEEQEGVLSRIVPMLEEEILRQRGAAKASA